jgi:DNA-binding transcriptional ArsR family regulator
MVNQSPAALDLTFSAVATPLRRRMLARLREGPVTAGDLWAGSGVTRPAITKNLGVLDQAGLITREKDGRRLWVALRAEPLRPASAWLLDYERFWTDRLDGLERFLDENPD